MVDASIFSAALEQGRTVLTEIESKRLLKQIGVATTEIELAPSAEAAGDFGRRYGFPVALKIVSPDISHKSDAGGVKVGLRNEAEVSSAYQEILSNVKRNYPSARIEGVAVQNMVRPGVEVIIGVSKDPQFGPIIMFGLGGIWVELIKDVAFRLVPIRPADAADMVREIKGYSLLKGFRNSQPVDIPALEDMLIKIAGYVEEHPEIKELDLNPVFAHSAGAVAVDARIILEEGGLGKFLQH